MSRKRRMSADDMLERRARALEEAQKSDADDPRRGPPVRHVLPTGGKVLRYFIDPPAKSSWYSTTTRDLRPSFFAMAANATQARVSGGGTDRVIAVLVDLDLPIIPTLRQQYAMVARYVASDWSLRWDGWMDVVVQYCQPLKPPRTISYSRAIEYVLYEARHARHIVIPSMSMTRSRDDFWRLPVLAASTGKTVAVLDQALDTRRHPQQLPALAAIATATYVDAYSVPQLGAKLTPPRGGIGWRKKMDRTDRGPHAVDVTMRTACRDLVAYCDATRLKHAENGEIWIPSEVLCQQLYDRFFSADSYANSKRFGRSNPRARLGARYMAAKMDFPAGLLDTIACGIITHRHLNPFAGEAFDAAAAREAFDSIRTALDSYNTALVYSQSSRFSRQVDRMIKTRYQPDLSPPWVTDGLADAPVESTAQFALPTWLVEADDGRSAKRILKELGCQHLTEEDGGLTCAVTKILAQDDDLIGGDARKEFVSNIGRTAQSATPTNSAAPSSSTTPTASDPDSPNRPPSASK